MRRVLDRIRPAVRGLAPGYFALVMATGIIATGMAGEGRHVLAKVVVAVTIAAYCVLIVLTLWRVERYPHWVAEDLTDPGRGFGFLTFVAGTNVLAAHLAVMGYYHWTAGLVAAAGLAWLLLGYVVPSAAFLTRHAASPLTAANGTWFMWVVSSQSVAVAATSLEPHVGIGRQVIAVVAVLTWSVGVFLYGLAGILVVLREMLYDFQAEDLDPSYWIAMGAASITVLAGAGILDMSDTPIIDSMHDLVTGLTVMCWALATWLIPALAGALWWRHVAHHIPLRYDAVLWSMIFPLGMYAVASMYLGDAEHLHFIRLIGDVELWVAFAAAIAVFVGLVHRIGTILLARPQEG